MPWHVLSSCDTAGFFLLVGLLGFFGFDRSDPGQPYAHMFCGAEKAGFSKRKHLPAHVTFPMLEAQLKALRDLQADQKLTGYGQQQSIRDGPMIKQMVNNFQAGMAKMKQE